MKTSNTSRQAGFGAIEVLLLLILLAILGFTGFYVYHSDRDKPAAVAKSDGKSSTAQQSATTTKPAATQKYLIVSEWGVKIPLSDDIADAYYQPSSNVSGTVFLSLNKYKGTDCAADDVALGAIERFTAQTTDADGNAMTADFPSAIKIGDYYYTYQHPQAACDGRPTNDNAGFDDAAAQQTSALMASFKTATDHIVVAN